MDYILSAVPITLIISVIVICITKRKEDKPYNDLDKYCILLNIVLSLVYIPLSLVAIVLAGFMWDSPPENWIDRIILIIVSYTFLLSPLTSIVSITLSVVLRKRGKSKLSFYIQFAPIAIPILTVLLFIIIGIIIP